MGCKQDLMSSEKPLPFQASANSSLRMNCKETNPSSLSSEKTMRTLALASPPALFQKKGSFLHQKNERILFENLNFLQKSPFIQIPKETYGQTTRIDYSQLSPSQCKKDLELQFLLVKMRKSQETLLHEFDSVKGAVFKFLMNYRSDLTEDLTGLAMQVLEQWDQEVYSPLTSESRECSTNLLLFSGLISEKSLRVKIQHDFSVNLAHTAGKVIETVGCFAKIMRINSAISIGEFYSKGMQGKIDLLRKMGSLSFSLQLELKVSSSLRKIAVSVFLSVEKHFSLRFLEKNTAEFCANSALNSGLLNKITGKNLNFPCKYGLNLSKSCENYLGFEFSAPEAHSEVSSVLKNGLSPDSIRRVEGFFSGLKSRSFRLDLKFDNRQLIEWEALSSPGKDETGGFLALALKSRHSAFLIKNVTLESKRQLFGLGLSSGAAFFVKKFLTVKTARTFKDATEDDLL